MEELVPPGNPLRPRALIYFGAGVVTLVVTMASDARFALSVPLGLLATAVAAFGALDFAGYFDDEAAPRRTLEAASWRPRALQLAVLSGLWLLALRLAVAGVLPGHAWTAPLAVTAASLAWVLGLGKALSLLTGAPAHARPGFWLMLIGVLLYIPWLGSYSLLDPWETHYGEVAREMLARDDWLSFWWAQDGWFWSKPALDFWLQGLSFALLGVRYRPDQMLAAAGEGHLPQPEWAARLPVVLLTLLATYCLYRFVSRAAGVRAGFCSGLVLLCMPYWSLLSHQSMTDMPYVAPLTAALSLFGLALLTDRHELAPALAFPIGKRVLHVSICHVLFGLVLLSALPQLCYLLSRNVTLQLAAPPYGFRWHLDELFSGSGMQNCGLPGNEGCRGAQPANAMFQPALGAVIFGSALAYLLHLNRGERRMKRLLYLGAWYFVALAALAKGAPGFVLPLAVAGAVLVALRQWRELTRVELAGLCLIFAAVALPWYVQAYMRHGEPFTDRLLFHDMYKRAFVHVHDTNAGTDTSIRYYLWQLGYGLFPWTGLAVAGLALLLEPSEERRPGQRELRAVSVLWLAVSFSLFTVSLTKFHHYALPCTPPLAIASGLAVDRALGTSNGRPGRYSYLALLGAGAALLLYAGRLLAGGDWSGLAARSEEGAPWLAAGAAAAGVVCIVLAIRRGSAPAEPDDTLAVLALPAALLTLLVARDLSTSYEGDVAGSARLLHLITYNYKRSWPSTLNFEAWGAAFGAVAALFTAALAWRRWRAHAATALLALGVCFCAFTLWLYLPRLAPHFGQRDLFLAYYRARQGPEQPIVAYQMNWKGENFYSGNRLPAFVSSGQKFKNWLNARRRAGTRVLFFVTEHGRISTLKSELGRGASVEQLTDRRLNDKFTLLRVQLPQLPSEPDS